MTPDIAFMSYSASKNGAISVCPFDFRNDINMHVLVEMKTERHLFTGNYVLCLHICKIRDYKKSGCIFRIQGTNSVVERLF